MELDLHQMAEARARTSATGRGAVGGFGYLFERVRRELAERWALPPSGVAEPGGQVNQANHRRVLLLDFDHAEHPLSLGEEVSLRCVSPLDSHGAKLLSPLRFPSPAEGTDGWDGVILGLQVAWLAWEEVLAEALRVLRPGGRLLFCTFGPDTLLQLREAWRQADDLPHVHPFTDMHILGDQLLGGGFTRPIVDTDRLRVEYPDAATLFADLRAEGFTNLAAQRRKTLTGKNRFHGFRQALEETRKPGAPLAITFELIYGAATAPPPPAPLRVAPPQVGGAG